MDIYDRVAPSTDQIVFVRAVNLDLAYRSRTFPMDVTVDGVAIGNQDVVQTEVTFWRDGGVPITAEMTRRPVRIGLPGGSHVVAFKVVATESSVPDNFHVDRDGDDLLVSWKVFDPDMALKVAVVRSGASGNVGITDEIGPGVRTSASPLGGLKLYGILFFGFMGTLFLVVVFLVLLGLFLRVSLWYDKLIPWGAVRNILTICVIITIVAVLYAGFQYDMKAVVWLGAKTIRPMPFQ